MVSTMLTGRFKKMTAVMRQHPLSLLLFGAFAIFILVQIASGARGCRIQREQMTVQGASMEGTFASGEKVLALYNYYECNDVERDDAVLFSFSGNPNPLLKVVRAIPGDRFELISKEQGAHILVNGQQLRNSEGRLYVLNEQRTRLLSLYVRDYKGVIPGGAYLILGNASSGSVDSTQFGLVPRSSITAKVISRQ